MSERGITLILNRLRGTCGEQRRDAETEVWRRFSEPMRRIARRRMRGNELPVGDEEDVAISVFRVFFRGVGEGRFERLGSGQQAFALLSRLTIDKTIDLIRFHKARRRCPDGAHDSLGGDDQERDGVRARRAASQRIGTESLLAQIADKRQSSADSVVEWKEEFDRLVVSLSEQTLQRIVTLKLQGYSNEEIAGDLGCVTRTVERKLEMIRRFWGPMVDCPREQLRVE